MDTLELAKFGTVTQRLSSLRDKVVLPWGSQYLFFIERFNAVCSLSECESLYVCEYVTGFAKGTMFTHNFNGYNNRLTVHVCTVATSSTVCFY